MRKVIFVGDSLTWGENPNKKDDRWGEEVRWTSLVNKGIKEKDVHAISIPGLAVKISPWDQDGIWCSTDHLFVEKSLKSYDHEIDDLFLFFGTNNYGAAFNGPKNPEEIRIMYQELIDSIGEWIHGIKNIYIMLLPNMSGTNNGKFTLTDLNDELLKLKNVQGFVDLTNIVIKSKDNVHFSEVNNREVADAVLKFISEKGEYE